MLMTSSDHSPCVGAEAPGLWAGRGGLGHRCYLASVDGGPAPEARQVPIRWGSSSDRMGRVAWTSPLRGVPWCGQT